MIIIEAQSISNIADSVNEGFQTHRSAFSKLRCSLASNPLLCNLRTVPSFCKPPGESFLLLTGGLATARGAGTGTGHTRSCRGLIASCPHLDPRRLLLQANRYGSVTLAPAAVHGMHHDLRLAVEIELFNQLDRILKLG